MGIIRLHSICRSGNSPLSVTVEVDIQRGLPRFEIIGLPDRVIRESRFRVRSAIRNSGFTFPLGKVTVSLLPADTPKNGGSLDLAIAIGVLAASRQIKGLPAGLAAIGELALDGTLKFCEGMEILPKANDGVGRYLYPTDMLSHAGWLDTYPCAFAFSLTEAVHLLINEKGWSLPVHRNCVGGRPYLIDSLVGMEAAKRAMLISLAGGHHLWLKGPPGIGKTRLVEAGAELLPDLNMSSQGVAAPFRRPHPSQAQAEIFGSITRLGELSLSVGGMIFFDEIPAFRPAVLDGLRGPLEERETGGHPIADVVCVAQNLCPCGKRGIPQEGCLCKPSAISRYIARASFPLLERFDIHCDVPYVYPKDLCDSLEPTAAGTGVRLRTQIAQARQRQTARNDGKKLNGSIRNKDELWGYLDISSIRLMKRLTERLVFSPRSLVAMLRVARTVADVAESDEVCEAHLLEACQYRSSILTEGKNLA